MKVGDSFATPEGIAQQSVLKINKGTLQFARECINAFLNSLGGQLIFGVGLEQKVVGIRMTQGHKDEFRLQMDSYVNAFTPQIDMDLVQTEFLHVDDVPDRFHEKMIDNLYVVRIVVKPSMEPIVFTSSAKAEAYYFNKIPILMTADLILNRCSYDKNHCVGAEGPEQ